LAFVFALVSPLFAISDFFWVFDFSLGLHSAVHLMKARLDQLVQQKLITKAAAAKQTNLLVNNRPTNLIQIESFFLTFCGLS